MVRDVASRPRPFVEGMRESNTLASSTTLAISAKWHRTGVAFRTPYDEAIALFTRILQSDPTSHVSHGLVPVLMATGELDRALTELMVGSSSVVSAGSDATGLVRCQGRTLGAGASGLGRARRAEPGRQGVG